MCLALVLVVASVSSVNLALTGISVDLGTTSSQLTWIADGYTVALAALVLPFGALGDRLGRRTLLLVGTVVFGLAALCAAARNQHRAAHRLSRRDGRRRRHDHAGHTVDDHRGLSRLDSGGRAVSVWAGFASSGAILGLLTCGLILEWFTWRATFVATAVLATRRLRRRPGTGPEHARSRRGRDRPARVPPVRESASARWSSRSSTVQRRDGPATNAVIGLAVAAAALVAFVALGVA